MTASEFAEQKGNDDIVTVIELHGTPAAAVAELGLKVSLFVCHDTVLKKEMMVPII
jgi:hypothetical protein